MQVPIQEAIHRSIPMRFIQPVVADTVELIPSVAVLKGHPVWVKDNRYHPFRHEGKRQDAIDIISALSEHFKAVHYMDLGGISKGDVDLDLLRDVCSLSPEIIADTGIAYSEMVIDAIMAGASKAVVSTKSVISLDEIASSFELTENLMVEIAWDGSRIFARDQLITDMTPAEFIYEMADLGITEFIVSNMDAEAGPIEDLLMGIGSSFPKDARVYIGASGLQDLPRIAHPALGALLSASFLLEGMR
ncbi:MAG: HisA/HisF-related TIM barrel protein [Candidatus Thermoplasmatota archaeon]|nr:HisA/HisF-related TIM barrel protein [Candidatus Thermoplasmatota archaeon]